MSRKYHTLCIWIAGSDASDPGCWADEFGSYDRAETRAEKDFSHSHDQRGHATIISHDDTAAAMIAARDALPAPKKGRHQ